MPYRRLLGAVPTLSLMILGLAACGPGAGSSATQKASNAPPTGYVVEEKTVAALQDDMRAGRLTSARLVELYVSRIHDLDRNGPTLRSVLSLNPRAAEDARRLDGERAQGRVRGQLHGIPILLKDNIESADPLPTTAGSLALKDNLTGRDAPIVARLRQAGAVILGKANLSEWANFRSTHSTSGWSAVGGLTRNPYALDRNACGSSAGSAVAVAANLVALAVGTETDGSITCPAAINGVVGFKPTVGLLSRRYIIPISAMQDTAGPMTRTVADAAALLSVMAGSDSQDEVTAEADGRKTDYPARLSADALRGKRLGVMHFAMGYVPALDDVFSRAVDQLKAAGAAVVVIDRFEGQGAIERREMTVMLTDFRRELNAYLATTPPAVTSRTLTDLIAFNKAQAEREMPFFRQELWEQSETTANTTADYLRMRAGNKKAAGPAGIDRLMREHKVDALIAPTVGPAWPSDLVNGDHILGGATLLAAVAGYPHLTVPMGQIQGLPVGLSFIGPAWSDAIILSLGYAFEQLGPARQPPDFRPTLDRRDVVVSGISPSASAK
jgi:amidase